jgi:uncharacterized protein
MTRTEYWFPGRLSELPAGECRELMGSTSVGRVAFVDEDGPTVLPVNYVLDGDDVLFRTAPDNTLGRHLEGNRGVASEETGWSVLVRGTATSMGTDDVSRDEALQPFSWAAGRRTQLVRIAPGSVTGRRLLPG